MTKTHTDRPAGRRTEFLTVEFDCIDEDSLFACLHQVTPSSSFGYLVTPNVDHIVRLLHSSRPADRLLGKLYRDAAWCVCDSRVLKGLARLRGVDLDVLPGSDLTRRIFDEVLLAGDTVAVVGGDSSMHASLSERYPHLNFHYHLPPMGLLNNPAALYSAASFIVGARARFTFVAVGSPQQELIAHAAAQQPAARGLAFCVGASIDFLTGGEVRAPRVVQRLGMEWAHRLARNPARLWRRYLVEGPRIFVDVARWKPGRPPPDGDERS